MLSSWRDLVFISSVLLGACASGCRGGVASPAACSAPASSAASSKALSTANSEFAAAFFKPAAAAVGTGNVVFSPYSVSSTLTMVDAGASGSTASQIQSVLHLPGDAATVAPAYASLACQNETDGSSNDNQLSFANSVWVQKGKSFKAGFESLLQQGYAAPLQQVDFAHDPTGATGAVNGWVSTATDGKIASLLQPGDVDASTLLLLVNAVYFAGAWQAGFDPAATKDQPFTRTDGQSILVPTMTGTLTAGGGVAQMTPNGPWTTTVELPYQGGALAMDILMPGDSLESFEAGLTSDVLTKALAAAAAQPSTVSLSLPKWSFTTRVLLAPVLSSMGITAAFEPKVADLSGMDGEHDLYVNRVVQQALIQVDEQGTVAAAATASVEDGTSAVVSPRMVTIDRPFVFVIRDTVTGSILFLGHVMDPSQGA